MEYITLGISLMILVKGADILIESASKLAKKLKVPSFIIGLFIIAIGTSAPEAAIGIISASKGTNLLTLGDVVGSNIMNILVIIGITAVISPLSVDSAIAKGELVISIIIQAIFIFMIYTYSSLSRIEALILLLGMLFFSSFVYFKSKKGSSKTESITEFEEEIFEYTDIQEEILVTDELENSSNENNKVKTTSSKSNIKTPSTFNLLFLSLIGLLGLIGGANFGVNSAVKIAHELGLSETIIGLTVVAFGTSLPELVTCLIAVIKKEDAIAIGNIVGSNIFNILFVMGISGIIHPIFTDPNIIIDLFCMLGTSFILFIPAFFRGRISRFTGIIYLVIYILYISFKIGFQI